MNLQPDNLPEQCSECKRDLAWQGIGLVHEPEWEHSKVAASWRTVCVHCGHNNQIAETRTRLYWTLPLDTDGWFGIIGGNDREGDVQ